MEIFINLNFIVMKRFYMIFAALLLIGSVCFAQGYRHMELKPVQQTNQTRETGWYGTSSAECPYYYNMEAGESVIIIPDSFEGASTAGEQLTKVKFGCYPHATYTGTSFTLKVYEGFSPDASLQSQGSTENVNGVLGTCVRTQNFTATSGSNDIILDEPYTIGESAYCVVITANSKASSGCDYVQISNVVDTASFDDLQFTSEPAYNYMFIHPASGDDPSTLDLNLLLLDENDEGTQVAFYEKNVEFQIYIQGAGEYVPSSDLEARFFGGISGNMLDEAEASYTLTSPDQELTLLPFYINNGPDDAVSGTVTIDITANNESILEQPLSYTLDGVDTIYTGGWYNLLPSPYSFTLSAQDMSDMGLSGTFDVCMTIEYTGNDPDLTNNSHCISVTLDVVTYTITATAGENGTINPSGDIVVNEGENASFTITANDSCRIVSVIVDDVDVTEAVVAANGVYTFENVTADHTIAATFERIPTYTITASANGSGTITPNGENVVMEGESLSFTIAANDCYRLVSVIVDEVESIESLVNGVYTFENVTANHTIAATFEQVTYTITATAGDHGTIDPVGEVVANCGEDKAFTITPESGYRILSLLVDGVSSQPAENNVYTFTNVRADHTIEVTFVDENATTHTIAATAGEHGSINPVGEIEVLGGENKEFTILADDCYRITSVLVDEVESIESLVNGVYTFENIAADHTIAATFEIITYTITASANEFGTITPNTEGGEIVNCGTDKSFTITANDSCRLVSVIVDGETNVTEQLVDGVYTFTNVAADHTIAATFERTPIHTITASANEFGTITPNGENVVMEGQSLSFTIAANDSCRLVSVMVDETNVTDQLVAGVYTFENIVADHSIVATFERIPTYTITATAGENGTITPSGVSVVMEGQSLSFTIAANNGYRVASVMVDGETNVLGQLANGVYTFTNINANHTIEATFEQVTTYTITATAGENGTINPSGVITVDEGATQAFTITPNGGYRIASVMVDNVEAIENVVDGVYIFQNVNANHTISVTFTESVSVDMVEAASMAIYPNPNTGMFSIDFSNINGDAIYQLIDARGAVVETRNISVVDGETMNFSYNLRAGAYFVRIISNDKVYVEQIVVE